MKRLDNAAKIIGNSVEYLETTNNLDLHFGDSNIEDNNKKRVSVSSQKTNSSGFVSDETNSKPQTFWGTYIYCCHKSDKC